MKKKLGKKPFLAEACILRGEKGTDNKQMRHMIDHVVVSAKEKIRTRMRLENDGGYSYITEKVALSKDLEESRREIQGCLEEKHCRQRGRDVWEQQNDRGQE